MGGIGRPHPADTIISLYEKHARLWDRARNKSLFERQWLYRFIAHLSPGGHVLDLGCGGGEPIAAYFISQGFSITGVDSSPSMIELCRSRFPEQEWLQADMRTLSPKTAFDGILAWDSFFHLTADDQRAMFPVFAKHAARGALLMFSSGPAEGEAIGELGGDPLYHASLNPEEYLELLHTHGFDGAFDRDPSEPSGRRLIWIATKQG